MTERSREDVAARREAMLPQLVAAMKRHHRQRRGRRRFAAGGLLLVLASSAWTMWRLPPAEPGVVAVRPPAPKWAPQIVRGHPRTGVIRMIDDDELVRRLAEIERPTGLIRVEGRARLTAAVTDTGRQAIEAPGRPEPSL